MALTINQVLRDWEVDGVAASGPHKPILAEMRALLSAMATGGATGLYDFIPSTNNGAGSANAIQVTTDVALPSTPNGALVALPIFADNTASPVTVAINGGPVLTVKTSAGNDVAPGGLKAGMIVSGYVSGSTFRMLSDQASAAIQAASEAAQAASENARDASISNADRAENYAAMLSADKIKFPTVIAAIADTVMSYAPGTGKVQVGAGDIIEAGGYRYTVAAAGATDQHVTTAGGVKLYAEPNADGRRNVAAWAAVATTMQDNAPSIQAALDNGSGEVTVPTGTWRVDSPIRVRDGKALRLNRGAELHRYADYSANTDPVVYVLGEFTECTGGSIRTENAHPDGIVRLGHEDLSDTVTATRWRLADTTLVGVQAAGNRSIQLLNAQVNLGSTSANYFGRIEDVNCHNSDVGVELLEICNGHQIRGVHFWNMISAAYRLRGAYENTIVGGFVHTATDGIAAIQLLNRTVGPHDSVGNMFLGIGIEPTGISSRALKVESGCANNLVQLFDNTAGSNVIDNYNNTFLLSYGGSTYPDNRLLRTGDFESRGYERSGPRIRKKSTGTVGENQAWSLLTVTIPKNASIILKLDLNMFNSTLNRYLSHSKAYALNRGATGDAIVADLYGGSAQTGAQDNVSVSASGGVVTAKMNTYNNGTASSNRFSCVAEVTSFDSQISVSDLTML